MKKTRVILMAMVLVLALVASACSKGGNSAGTDNAEGSQNGEPASANAGAAGEGNDEGVVTKFDPPITVTTVRSTDAAVKFKEGESYDNNAWMQSYKDNLGVNVKYNWIVNSDQYEQKLNVSIASGDLPDFFRVNATQLQQLIDNDAIEDLTPYYEKYGSDLLKDFIERGADAKKAAMSGDKLMALPPQEDHIGSLDLLWVRTDWLQKLNLPEPKTMDDVMKIAEAFAKNDPDGNGKADTFGLAGSKELWSGYPSFKGFVNGYGAYQGMWVKDDAGQLVYSSIQPEMREALGKLQEMYKAGLIDREFGVKDGGKAAELQASGRVGMSYGQQWNPLWPLVDSVKNDPNADWKPFAIPSADGQPASPQSSVQFNEFTVVKKGAKHPEAVIMIANQSVENLFGENADAQKYHSQDGIEFFKYSVVMGTTGTPAVSNIERAEAVMEALKSGDTSKLDGENKGYYDKIEAFEGGDRSAWGYIRVFGEGGSQDLFRQYRDGQLNYTKNEFFGAPTKTMTAKKSTLDKLELETFTNIILGNSLDNFDKFVADWKKLGGDDMTKEVNDWYAKNQ